MPRTTLQFRWREPSAPGGLRSGVSLHSHTTHSQEALDLILDHGDCWLVRRVVDWIDGLHRRREGTPVDWRRAFWTPPLQPKTAVALERVQIENRLGMQAMVSLTDHDSCEAGWRLQSQQSFRDIPISLEWTVPFGGAIFHIGVHNLPRQETLRVMTELLDYSQSPDVAKLADLLNMLDGFAETLLVLNHPLYDEGGIGDTRHLEVLHRFLGLYSNAIHALELNGLRDWRENQRVIALANRLEIPLVSGGDRHGLEPNANLNLTAAATFPEFVFELRYRKRSHIIFMEQYRANMTLRRTRAVLDVLKYYPSQDQGARCWADRIFYRGPSGNAEPIASLWRGEPANGQPFRRVELPNPQP